MIWVDPSVKGAGNAALEKRLWDAAQFRANSGFKFQFTSLHQNRDLLLPRLLSGQVNLTTN